MLIAIGFIASSAERAAALTADDVMNKMTPDERTAYLAGAVEAFAQSRWITDKPNADGMRCIQDWFYARGEETRPDLYAFLSEHLEKPAPAMIYVMLKRECGG